MTLIISGFPGVGKSYFTNNSDLKTADSDSSKFSWLSEGVRHPDFPNNYMQHIRSLIGHKDVIFVSSHKVVRDALREANYAYIMVYPDKSIKEEYIQRYIDRGNNEGFVKLLTEKWDEFIDEIESEEHTEVRKLQKGQYLADVVEITQMYK